MIHQLSLAVIALLLGSLTASSTQAQDIQRGNLKTLDVEQRIVVMTIDGKDHELGLTDDTQVPGGRGKSLAEKLRDFKEGSEIAVWAVERGGRRVVQTMRLAEPGKGAPPQAGGGAPPPAGEGGGRPQRGKLKRLDIEQQTVVVTIDGRDRELALTENTQVPGGQGKSLAEKLRDFKEGSEIAVWAVERGGRQVVQGIRLIESGKGAQPQAGSGGGGVRLGRVKTVDAAGRTITLTVGTQDVAMAVTDQTEIRGARGETLAEPLKGLEPGTQVMFLAADRDGRKVLVRLVMAGLGIGGAIPLKPLDELGAGKYQGYVGGLYPDGRNVRPSDHEAAGMKLAAQVRPLNAEGKPDAGGKIVVLSIGMSNASQSWRGFQRVLSSYDRKNSRLLLVDGAQDAMTAAAIRNPDDSDTGVRYWSVVDQRLDQAGATRAQVQAIWIKEANYLMREPFPAYASMLQAHLMQIVKIFPRRFPNAKLVYLSSRSYAGFATTPLNPEPLAYESGFAVKWLIEEQIRRNPAVNYDPARGPVNSPWLSWGPYFWASGSSKRATDGLNWEPTDFGRDGIHLSEAGQGKIGRLLLEFFKNDSTTRGWFNRRQSDGVSPTGQSRRPLRLAARRCGDFHTHRDAGRRFPAHRCQPEMEVFAVPVSG
jgi:Cu/Ag efflux protein CusF